MKRLWVAAALAPLTFAAAQARAATCPTSSTNVYTPVTTAACGDVTVSAGQVLTPYDSGTSSGISVSNGTSAAQGAAVTVNSDNTVTNDGTISYNAGVATGASYAKDNYATGILAQGGYISTITNVGTISVTETTSYTDANSDGIDDTNYGHLGQYASGNNRYGIQTVGPLFLGGISNGGTISVIGENSAGIFIGAGGIQGLLSNLGTISVTGGNSGTSDVSYGINALGSVGSFLNEGGTISALGQNAIAVNLAGGTNNSDTVNGVKASGAVEIYGSITATGYRSTTAPTIPSVLSLVQAYASSELLQGGPALVIGGSVVSGISLDAPITATSSVSAVVGATVTSYGRAPALLIGGTSNIAIGQWTTTPTTSSIALTSSDGYGLYIGGTVTGSGLYDTDNAGTPVGGNAIQIGVSHIDSTTGLYTDGSSQVTIAGGISITGTVSAIGLSRTAVADPTSNNELFGGSVTALHLGNVDITGAETQTATNGTVYDAALNIQGVVSAASTATVAVKATAIQIDAATPGATTSVASLYNRGSIIASITGIAAVLNTPAAGGTDGVATAIVDKSGSLGSVVNSGLIEAAITPIDPTKSLASTARTIAIDLSQNTTGASVLQVADSGLTAVTTSTTVTTTVTPTIIGDVLFGSGNGSLDLEAGSLTGGMSFGTATGNAITVNSAIAIGPLAEATGGSLAINVGTATGATTSILDITAPVTNKLVSDGGVDTAIGVSTINIGSAGQLILTVDPAVSTTATQLQASGAVTIAQGGTIGLNFLTKLSGSATYDIITASSFNLAGAQNPTTTANAVLGALPYLYKGSASVVQDGSGYALAVTVTPKTTTELGLNKAESAAFNAVYAAFDNTSATGASASAIGDTSTALLTADTRSAFLKAYDQFLPDYSGGPFEDLVLAQEALAAAETDQPEKLETDATRGWVQEITYYNSRSDTAEANGYTSKGFGFAGGAEKAFGHSAVGVAAAFVDSSVHDLARSDGSSQGAAAVEAGVYWRSSIGGLNMGASVNGGWASLESKRALMEQSGTDAATLYRLAKANWIGGLGSASFNISYKEAFGRYYIKPEAVADYEMLYESGYSEHGGGESYDLSVNSKLSKEAVVQGDMVLGATYGTATRWSPELTLGWREVVYGGPDTTTAHFSGGAPFTLSPDYLQKGGAVARIGVRASGNFADFNASAGGIFRSGYQTYDARAAARFLF